MLKLKSVDFERQQFRVHCLQQSHVGQFEWVVGRNPTCDLVLPSPDVSRVHGRVLYCDEAYYFMDEGSTSGSVLNSSLMPANEPQLLRAGDLLQLGEVLLYIEELSPIAPKIVPSPARMTPQIPEQVWAGEDIVCRCCRIVQETPDVKTFSFVADPPLLFQFKPGQFVNLEVEIEGQPAVRCYSIASSPTRPYHLDLTVKRSPGLGSKTKSPPGLVSNWLHDHFKVGDRVRLLGGAMGQFTCLPDVPAKMLLISAGSGIVPVMSMARWVEDMLLNPDIVFLYSARTLRDVIFRAELASMAAKMPNFHLAVTLTQPPHNQAWMGLTGRVSSLMLNLVVPDLLERAVYVCGSEGFTEQVRDILESMHFPMENYQAESFGGEKVVSSKGTALAAAQPVTQPATQPLTQATQITLPSPQLALKPGSSEPFPRNGTSASGHPAIEKSTILIEPAATAIPIVVFAASEREVLADGSSSVLELAEQAGVKIRHACRAGACGACKVIAREGEAHYATRPVALTPADEAAGYVISCVAYPSDRLVIEA